MGRRVVVTGIGLICGVGNTAEEVWKNLLAGKSGVGRITHFDTSQYACQIAAEVKNFDPLQFVEKKEVKMAEIVVQAEHKHDLVAREHHGELLAAVDLAVEKLEGQLRRYKEKIQDHRRTPPTGQVAGAAIGGTS